MEGSRINPGAVQHPEPGDVRAEIPGGWAVSSILRRIVTKRLAISRLRIAILDSSMGRTKEQIAAI
jgi:hypothetical protein